MRWYVHLKLKLSVYSRNGQCRLIPKIEFLTENLPLNFKNSILGKIYFWTLPKWLLKKVRYFWGTEIWIVLDKLPKICGLIYLPNEHFKIVCSNLWQKAINISLVRPVPQQDQRIRSWAVVPVLIAFLLQQHIILIHLRPQIQLIQVRILLAIQSSVETFKSFLSKRNFVNYRSEVS